MFEGECQACESFLSLNDLGLCDDCGEKLDRDMIRERAWDYSTLAFGISDDKREALRRHIIQEFGERYELISPQKKNTSDS
ncbi:MAG: hypothetical protein AB8G77_24585 [Rhodothermales bacterium]